MVVKDGWAFTPGGDLALPLVIYTLKYFPYSHEDRHVYCSIMVVKFPEQKSERVWISLT